MLHWAYLKFGWYYEEDLYTDVDMGGVEDQEEGDAWGWITDGVTARGMHI